MGALPTITAAVDLSGAFADGQVPRYNAGTGLIDPTTLTASIVNADASGAAATALAAAEAYTDTAVAAREPAIAAGTTSQYWRGDKSWRTLNATAVGLGNVLNAKQVTSIALTAPNVLYTTPVNWSVDSAGAATATLALATQSANTVLAGPTTGAAATPTMRALVAGDVPSLSAVYLPLAGGAMAGDLSMGGHGLSLNGGGGSGGGTLRMDAGILDFGNGVATSFNSLGMTLGKGASGVFLGNLDVNYQGASLFSPQSASGVEAWAHGDGQSAYADIYGATADFSQISSVKAMPDRIRLSANNGPNVDLSNTAWDYAGTKLRNVGLDAASTDPAGNGQVTWWADQSTTPATVRPRYKTSGGALQDANCPSAGSAGAALTKTDDANVTLTLGGTPASALLNAASLTLGWTGQLAIARGGTGQTTANAALNALLPAQAGNSGKFLTTDATNASWASVTVPIAANPTAAVGLTAVNGAAATFLRSDGAPALSQAIVPTWTGAHAWSTNGVVSIPPVLLTGTWFTGGTATTTKPQLLVEPAGTASTGWSTSGTGIGVNSAAGFTGHLINLSLAGARVFTVAATGVVSLTGVENVVGPVNTAPLLGAVNVTNATNSNAIELGFPSVSGAEPCISMYVSGLTNGRIFQRAASTKTVYIGDIDANGGGAIIRANGSDVIKCTSAGLVGVQCTPLSALDVNGGAAFGTYAGANAAPPNGLIVSGSVGIGTSSTTSGVRLTVNGAGQFLQNDDSFYNNNSTFGTHSNGFCYFQGSTGGLSVAANNTRNDAIYLRATHIIDFWTNNALVATLGSSGKVGLNVASGAALAGLDVQTPVTAASAVAYGTRLAQTLTAAANNDVLNALYINPAYADGGFTGVTHNALNVVGNITASGVIAGQALFSHYADAGSTGTTETDLYSDTLAAGQLATNGDKLEGEYGVTLVNSTSTKQLKLYFGGTAIFDTGALTISASSEITLYFSIVRDSSTTIRYSISAATTGASTGTYSKVGKLTGLTLSGTNVLKITGTAAGVGSADNDVLAIYGTVRYSH